jgi:hypothetical protein
MYGWLAVPLCGETMSLYLILLTYQLCSVFMSAAPDEGSVRQVVAPQAAQVAFSGLVTPINYRHLLYGHPLAAATRCEVAGSSATMCVRSSSAPGEAGLRSPNLSPIVLHVGEPVLGGLRSMAE